MSNDKSNDSERIVIDTTKLRGDAGKRLDNKVNSKSGIIALNEGGNLGIGHEFFTKENNENNDKIK